jgi:hypothetical protein
MLPTILGAINKALQLPIFSSLISENVYIQQDVARQKPPMDEVIKRGRRDRFSSLAQEVCADRVTGFIQQGSPSG